MVAARNTLPRQQRTILIVEDDEDTRTTISDLLEDHGYRVVATPNGRAAEAYLIANPPPDCMVMDLWMPEMNGWTLAARMKRGQLPAVPTVVVTAAEPQWGYPSSAKLALRKPLDSHDLLRAVRSLAPPDDSGG
jgi:CheY-like chemotaxis protein